MFLKTVLVNRRLLALEVGDLVKSRGIAEFRLRDTRNWPGDDLQNRNYRRTWFNQRDSASKIPEGPTHRLDDTMYSPKRYRERKYQATWREASAEDKLECQQKQEVREEPRHQTRVRNIPDEVPQRIREPLRRLQRVAIPAGEFFSKFKSEQKKQRMRHYEAEVIADRLSNDEYQMV